MERFHLESALDSEFFRGGVWAPTFLSHTEFEVENVSEFFRLQSTLDCEFFLGVGGGVSGHQVFWSQQIWGQKKFVGGGLGTNFFGHANFRSKIFQNFFLYQVLWTLNFFVLEICLGTNFFWTCQIWGQKVFRIFSFTKQSGLWIFWGGDWSRHQHFLVMLNLRSKNFQNFFIYRALRTLNFLEGGVWYQLFLERGLVQAPTFFGHAKLEVKNFLELFHSQCTLDSEFLRGGVWAWTIFGHAKFETKNIS